LRRGCFGERQLAAPAGVHDPEDHDPVRFPPVLDEVVPQVILADIGRTSLDRMTDLGKALYAFEGVPKELSVHIFLITAPRLFSVLQDRPQVPQRLGGVIQPNT